MERLTCDVLVIGAGVAGAALAASLPPELDVLVAERRQVCAGSSGLNAGGVRHQFTQPPNIEAAKRTIAWVNELDAAGVDMGFQRAGYLFLFTDQTNHETFSNAVAVQNELGVRTTLVTASQAADIVPGLNVDDLVGAAFGPDDGYLDPHSFTTALAGVARSRGVRFLENAPVSALDVGGSAVTAVRAGDLEIRPRMLVNAAGVWATEIAALYGGRLPIEARRSSLFNGLLPEAASRTLPMVLDFEQRTFFHSEGARLDAAIFGIGGATPVDGFPADVACEWSRLEEALPRLVHRYPAFADAQVTHGWSGLVEATPDDNPFVGWTHLENVYTLAGFAGHGMCIAPGIATQAARELQGLEPEFDLGMYRIERLEGAQAVGEGMFGVTANASRAGL
jgi:sarcosine oxidase, subunit beta